MTVTPLTDEEQAAIRRADYERYRALVSLFVDAILDGPEKPAEIPPVIQSRQL